MSVAEEDRLEVDKVTQVGHATTSASSPTSKNGKAKGKGGRGAREEATPTIQLSKALSYILRHGAAKEHLKVGQDGYISLDAVLARPKVSKIKMENNQSPTIADVMSVVESNDKKRFEITVREADQVFIRAVQGHSIIEVTSLDHIPLTLSNLSILSSSSSEAASSSQSTEEPHLPEGVEILHGTSQEAWEKIKTSGGLDRMKRNHIHLAKGRPGSNSVISGMRNSSAIIIHIDLIAALLDQIPFFVASNGAVLTSGEGDTGLLPFKYISRVEESKTGKTIWQPK